MKKYLFGLILVALIIGGLYIYFILGNQMRSMRGDALGKSYINKMYTEYTTAGSSCQGEDTNNDGYITCNFRIKSNADNTEKTINLQCPTFIKSYLATSCKELGILNINQV